MANFEANFDDFDAPFDNSFDLILGKVHVYGFPPTPSRPLCPQDVCQLCGKPLVTVFMTSGTEQMLCRRCGANPFVQYLTPLTDVDIEYRNQFIEWQSKQAKSRQPGSIDINIHKSNKTLHFTGCDVLASSTPIKRKPGLPNVQVSEICNIY